MIRVGIIGCEGLGASELVRILINHPDVELKWVADAACGFTRLDRVVPGIVGESDLMVNTQGSLEDVNLVFLCCSRDKAASWLQNNELPEDLKVIDLSGSHNLDCSEDSSWTYGMGEMLRRVLVHEAQLVTVPGMAAVAVLLALMPMARNLMLNSPLSLQVSAGSAVLKAAGLTAAGIPAPWIEEQRQELCHALKQCQSSFDQPVELTVTPIEAERLLTVEVRFKSGIDLEMLNNLYEQYYDDHNFVFLMDRQAGLADVENTNKCLLHLSKEDNSGTVTVTGVMDGLLKAGVGNAVHAMNLMFGLYERIGLMLKASGC